MERVITMPSSSPLVACGSPARPIALTSSSADRTTTFTGEIVLRMDSRLDRPRARMEVRLRQDETILRRDTLQVDFAATAGDWKRPGALYHEFVLPLARPLQAPYTGLFSLEVRPLDTIPLSGVAAIGLHTAELRAE